ncbi:uncharacterized protein LOC111265014 isoform X1 [Varroa jacobsoni]|uniref:uncharacterized protein LOC111265014 isoform X1 n=1 Tax=Varroa jacobsoni TaxID=62625 RepID=UPI000BF5F9B5|nr:uncharacterized protein LOC111265014 isoform X1 [Varroa jacobsoni]
MVIIKRSSRQIRHTSSAVVKATKVSLVDESGKLEDLQYEGENITKCFQPAPKSSPTSLTQNPMSLSIAVSVKEIGDITTQTNGAGEDGSETKLAGAAAGEDIIISHKAAMIGSGHSDEVQPNEISATNHIEENGSALQNNEQDDPGVVNSIIELANGSNVDEADGHVSACNTTSEAVVDTESDKIGTIENAVSDFVEKMVSAIANAIDSAANETDNQNNNEKEPERVTSASENSRHLNNVDKDHDQHAFAEALATVTATAVSTPVDYVAEPQPANEFRNGASAENSQIITASEAPVASVSFSVKDSNAPANLGEESAVESTTEQSDIDGVERDTPSTDLADKGNYESDVTTPGDQMVEVNIETTPESNLVDDDTEDAREEFTGESRPEIESDFISPLSAISERSGSAFQVTEAIADVESEQKKPEEFEYTERQRQHPGDVYDDKSDDQLHEPYEDLDVDNGQPVACTSSTPVVPPSPPVVAQRGSVVGSAHSAPAASSRTASAVIHRSQMSAASKRSSSGVSRWSPTLQKVSRTSSAAAPPRTSRANSATVFPKTSSRAASATSIVPKGASRASSATKQGSRGSSGIARGETFIKESKKDDEEEQQQQLSLGLIKSAKTIIDDSVNNAARTLSASVHSTSLSHEDMEKLRAKLDNLRAERRECEAQKEEMVRHVKGLQGKLIQEKETVHDMWKKRYYEEKKITPKLEEESAKLRQELERIHRDLITRVEGRDANDARSSYTRLEEPSNKLSYKIMISGLLQEIEDLKRRLESTKLRLSAEAKLRAMAEKDVRTLREDLIQKKIQVTLTRKETDSVIAPFYRDTIYSLHPMI